MEDHTNADERIRILAARLRIVIDTKLGRHTPPEVVKLANKPDSQDR